MLTEWMRPIGMRIVLGAVLAGVMAPAAAAQTNGDLAEACVQAVRAVAVEASEDVRAISERTVEDIQQLADDGAPNGVIFEAGRDGIERIHRRAGLAGQRVRHLVDNCVGELQDNNAAPALIARVREAGRNARERIDTARSRAVTRVQRAMRAAVSP